ncbi:glycoside hydrolase family 88 protein [Paraglaciecola aquimarina]|uniref:Glycoside hydrolase family 88 protein n=1 Tax=Paraglaciecola aquimarina TaxID=1235557 RepID=A0ABU3SRK6_9ALTE|nr:glycoside hydrolase family 88 protein [Paraglaciecola aquimarina]MDU0352619.1 glycoside hydrolase family 88 protein [Paraglaciecola aquimarina]
MSNITGDPKYFEYADKEFWATTDYLFSEKHHMYFRDSRYFTEVSDNGKPVFWSRGNGWVFAGLPLIIDDLPKDHPSRDKYISLFKRFASGLQAAQKADGYWAPSLLDPNKVKTPETSGTGFITFGLAWGVNNGILTEDKYKTSVEKGWAALEKAVKPNGKVTWVQQVGKSPDPVAEHETQFYGVGAVLLAASEMTKWSH